MGWTVGIPSLKLNNIGNKSKHCGNFRSVAAEALKERKGHDPDINPALTASNRYIGFTSAAELEAYSNEHVSQLRDAKGRVLRKDAVVMCVTIFKPPAALMNTLCEEDQLQFLEDGTAKIRQIVGEENVKAEAWHFDEQGGHVHVFWEPMTEDGRLCAKEKHNMQFLGRLNREIPEHLRAKGWDIDNCNAYDAAMDEIEKAQRRQAAQSIKRTQNGNLTISTQRFKKPMMLWGTAPEPLVISPGRMLPTSRPTSTTTSST